MGRKDTAVVVWLVCTVMTTAFPQTQEELQQHMEKMGKTPAQLGIPADLARHLAGRDRRVDRSTAEAVIRQMWLAANGRVSHPSIAMQRELNRIAKQKASSLLEAEARDAEETTEETTTEQATYMLSTSAGPCPSGYDRIWSKIDCAEAAKDLELKSEVLTTAVKTRPGGCYYMPEHKQLWYHDEDNRIDAGGDKRQSICGSVASADRRAANVDASAKAESGSEVKGDFDYKTYDPFVPMGDYIAETYKKIQGYREDKRQERIKKGVAEIKTQWENLGKLQDKLTETTTTTTTTTEILDG